MHSALMRSGCASGRRAAAGSTGAPRSCRQVAASPCSEHGPLGCVAVAAECARTHTAATTSPHPQDVCYSWWCLSALSILGRLHWIDQAALADFILDCQVCGWQQRRAG